MPQRWPKNRINNSFLLLLVWLALLYLLFLTHCKINSSNNTSSTVKNSIDIYRIARSVCVETINNYRKTEGKIPYTQWNKGEDCADQQAEYDSKPGGSPHAGWKKKICAPKGRAQNECPGWPAADVEKSLTNCLKVMWDEQYTPSGEQGHYLTMSSTKYDSVACGFYKTENGRLWMVQNFK